MQQNSMTICVTGAAGQIAYSFIPQLASGICFPGVRLHLRLLDIQPALNILRGVALELEDCSYPLVRSVRIIGRRCCTASSRKRCSKAQM